MSKFIVRGGKKLVGRVKISGSKNAALPIICAALLTDQPVILKNVPDIADIHSMTKIIEHFGVKTEFSNGTLTIDAKKLVKKPAPEDLVKKMRASILILGALLPRIGEVKMAFPGGCVLGKRSVSTHTSALEQLGCQTIDHESGLHIKVKSLIGSKIILPEMSVTATENAIMAAVLAKGDTEIHLAACEPHVEDLCNFLKKMGAKISGIGTTNLKISGVPKLNGCTYSITGDYLEAGTFAIAAVATKGHIALEGLNSDHLNSVWQKLQEVGAEIIIKPNEVEVIAPKGKLKAITMLRTSVHPGFPTDLQAPFTVLLTQANGVSKVFETLFEGRLNYLFELELMGAHVEFLNPHQAIIIGPRKLKAMPISSFDIRAGAAMVIAALIAPGETVISNINYIDRGYQHLEQKLRSLGADIERSTED
ncbi:UDP-N-acetylglucosamine 1-carboxyvinyltransferase [Candidatus Gracilibacteria bacterium]|nr:UDP-N-acetylglucosamine 1-carboxyvinyltransferase [Candidatus Gracilibacteria bacterium]